MKLLRDKKLNNGVHLAFYNGSKPVAGDRWLVVLNIISTMPLSDKMLNEIAKNEDSQCYLDKFDGVLSFELERKKHFVDEKIVEDSLEELMVLAESNMVEYFSHPNFADKLFSKQMEAFKDQCLLEKNVQQNKRVATEGDEPEDFSACFK